MVALKHHQLLPHADFALTHRGDPTSYRRHALTAIQVQALDKGRVDLPATGRQYLLDCLQHAEHDPGLHAVPPPHGLDHLRLEQPG